MRIYLIQSPLPFDIRKVDINEGRPNGHCFGLQVARYDQIIKLFVYYLHSDLLLEFQEAQDNAEALRANNQLAQLP